MPRNLLLRWPPRRRRPAWPIVRRQLDLPQNTDTFHVGRAWQRDRHRRLRRQKAETALHWFCCIIVPGLFILAAWLFCIGRLIGWLTRS